MDRTIVAISSPGISLSKSFATISSCAALNLVLSSKIGKSVFLPDRLYKAASSELRFSEGDTIKASLVLEWRLVFANDAAAVVVVTEGLVIGVGERSRGRSTMYDSTMRATVGPGLVGDPGLNGPGPARVLGAFRLRTNK